MIQIEEIDGQRPDTELVSIQKENDQIREEIKTLVTCEKDISYCLEKIDEKCIPAHRKDLIKFRKEYYDLMSFYFENIEHIESSLSWMDDKILELKSKI